MNTSLIKKQEEKQDHLLDCYRATHKLKDKPADNYSSEKN